MSATERVYEFEVLIILCSDTCTKATVKLPEYSDALKELHITNNIPIINKPNMKIWIDNGRHIDNVLFTVFTVPARQMRETTTLATLFEIGTDYSEMLKKKENSISVFLSQILITTLQCLLFTSKEWVMTSKFLYEMELLIEVLRNYNSSKIVINDSTQITLLLMLMLVISQLKKSCW